MIDSRTRLLGALYNLPILPSDATVVLTGEDGEERLAFGIGLFKQGASNFLVLSGGVDSESQQSAKTLYAKALSAGIHHERIITDDRSTNTREQAVDVVERCLSEGWKRILLVASPNHLPRAFLTFLKALQEKEATEEICVVPLSANQVSWFGKPRGQTYTRDELYQGEFAKIALYHEHTASYDEAISYLKYWEARR